MYSPFSWNDTHCKTFSIGRLNRAEETSGRMQIGAQFEMETKGVKGV